MATLSLASRSLTAVEPYAELVEYHINATRTLNWWRVVGLFDFAFQENPDYFLSNPIFRLRYDFLLNKNNDKKSILNVQDRVSMWSHLNKN